MELKTFKSFGLNADFGSIKKEDNAKIYEKKIMFFIAFFGSSTQNPYRSTATNKFPQNHVSK